MGLEICKACLKEELEDTHDTGSWPGDVYTIVEPDQCKSGRHQD